MWGMETESGMIWHCGEYIAAQGPFTAMFCTGLNTPPRFFLAQQAATGALYYFDLPLSDNPLQEPQSFNASGTFFTSFHDCGFPGVPKTFEEVIVAGDSLTANETLTISFRTTETAAWTAITGAVTSSPTVKRPAAVSSGEGIQFQVALARGTTVTNTPVLRSLKARMILRPDRATVIQTTVRLEDYQLDRLGHPRPESAKTLVDGLTGLEDDTTPFTVLTPLDDGTGTVESLSMLLVGDVEIREAEQQDITAPVRLATLRMREVGA